MRDLKSEINNRYMDIAQASRHAESKTKLINNLNKDLESINQSLEAQRLAFIKNRTSSLNSRKRVYADMRTGYSGKSAGRCP